MSQDTATHDTQRSEQAATRTRDRKRDIEAREQELAKLKRSVLGTGYPLEASVIEAIFPLLGAKDEISLPFVFGTSTWGSPGLPTFRSLDFAWTPNFSYAAGTATARRQEKVHLHFLIDAKTTVADAWYAVPSWGPRFSTEFPFILPCNNPDIETTYAKGLMPLAALPKFPRITGGRKVTFRKDGGDPDTDRDELYKGFVQVLQGQLAKIRVVHRALGSGDGPAGPNRDAHFFFPIIVTNAPIKLIGSNATLKAVEGAKSEDEFCKPIDGASIDLLLPSDLNAQYEELQNRISGFRQPTGDEHLQWKFNTSHWSAVTFLHIDALLPFLNQKLSLARELTGSDRECDLATSFQKNEPSATDFQ